MNELTLIEQRTINNVLVDGYYGSKEAWFTRFQIGSALEYDDPQNAITVIHKRHRERLDQFSRRCQIDTPSGRQEGFVYSIRGVLEICRWSKQPKADMIMDALYDMAESVMDKGYYSVFPDEKLIELLTQRLQDNPKLLKYTDGLSPAQKKDADKLRREADYQELRKNWKTMEPREVTQKLSDIFFDDPRRFERENNKFIYWYNHNKISRI